jgi:hypothetical protein
MCGFTVTVNAWGIHIGLHRALRPAETAEWQAAVREAGERLDRGGRPQGLFVDLRGAGALAGGDLDALATLMARAGVRRCAVLSGNGSDAAVLAGAGRQGKLAGRARIFVSDGRDRPLLAAAYAWVLNAVEPAIDLHRGGDPGKVIPFPAPRASGQPGASAGTGAAQPRASRASA